MLRPLRVERVVVRIWGPPGESGDVFVEGNLDEVVIRFFSYLMKSLP